MAWLVLSYGLSIVSIDLVKFLIFACRRLIPLFRSTDFVNLTRFLRFQLKMRFHILWVLRSNNRAHMAFNSSFFFVFLFVSNVNFLFILLNLLLILTIVFKSIFDIIFVRYTLSQLSFFLNFDFSFVYLMSIFYTFTILIIIWGLLNVSLLLFTPSACKLCFAVFKLSICFVKNPLIEFVFLLYFFKFKVQLHFFCL